MGFEEIAVSLLWGSLLSHYLWFKKQQIYDSVKQIALNSAKKVWHNSKAIIKNKISRKTKFNPDSQDSVELPQNTLPINTETNKKQSSSEQKPKSNDTLPKQKKITKKYQQKPKNLRKITKRYQDWLISHRDIRKMKQSPLLMQEQIQKISSRKSNESKQLQIGFAKKKINEFEQGLKSFEQYLQPDELLTIANVTAYNPLIEDMQADLQLQQNLPSQRS